MLTALSRRRRPSSEHLLRPLTRWLGERGRAVSGPEFGLAIGALRRYAAGALDRAGAVRRRAHARPSPTPPLPVGAIRDDADPAADFEAQKAFTPWTSAWNVTGMPAVSLPLHWTDDGLPVGVMLAARPAEEELLLSLCRPGRGRRALGTTGGRRAGDGVRTPMGELTPYICVADAAAAIEWYVDVLGAEVVLRADRDGRRPGRSRASWPSAARAG